MVMKLVSAPTTEPLTLTEAKTHLRVDNTDSDAYITSLIKAARQWGEQYLHRALEPQTWDIYLDGFYQRRLGARGPWWGLMELPTPDLGKILLPLAPVTSITHVKYTDTAGTWQTLASSAYQLDDVSEPARLRPAYNTTWPETRADANVVWIRAVFGYARVGSPDESGVPAPIKQALLLLIGDMYDRRADTQVGAGQVTALPRGAEALMHPYRLPAFV